jgi:predicted O-methyltransferase YrrM
MFWELWRTRSLGHLEICVTARPASPRSCDDHRRSFSCRRSRCCSSLDPPDPITRGPGSPDRVSLHGVKITHHHAYGWRARSIFAALRLRPVNAQHSAAESALLKRCAKDRRLIVEIGVAEGGSAAEIRQVMHPEGDLYLIDPYHLSGAFRSTQRVAHRAVESVDRARVTWIEDFSIPAAVGWDRPIDLLFIDGDHSVEGARLDWDTWSPWVVQGGLVALHDASTTAPGVDEDCGPARVARAAVEDPRWHLIDQADTTIVLQHL